jgi:copper resistance protein B
MRIILLFFLYFLLSSLSFAETQSNHLHQQAHGGQIFHKFSLESAYGIKQDESLLDWNFDGWIGTDDDKLNLKSEIEHEEGGNTEKAELWALYSKNISTFWDAQIGMRYDIVPEKTAYLTLGFSGLAPYFIETETYMFISNKGDVSARLESEMDVLLTQYFITKPYVELNVFMQDVPELEKGQGLATVEFGIQTRYEIDRKFAPYIDLRYEADFSETSNINKNADALLGLVGLKLMF